MQLNITTDYAIRMLLCLGQAGKMKPGPVIAEEMKIPPKYIMKISSKLREAKLIGSIAGAQGGYYLERPLDEITMLEVLELMEPSMKVNRCLEPDAYCNRGTADTCPVRRFYLAVQSAVEEHWASLSLARIIQIYGGPETKNDRIIGIEEARQQVAGGFAHPNESRAKGKSVKRKADRREEITYSR
nr:Rrf2 family transcriptional regulator [uncultured Mediterraneibacter sp.]